jgi:transcription antitermination factor NusG
MKMRKPAAARKPINQLHETEPRWFAVRTRFKCEKYAQGLLEKKGITAYVPLQHFVRRYTRKVKTVDKPLISCYVFVKIAQSEYLPVLETENIAGFVRMAKCLVAIPEHEIQILRRITLEEGLDIDIMEGAFESGDRVEIVAGNLIGLQGRVIGSENKQRLQIELETLGYSLLLTLDAALLQKIQPRP